ncbi:hypothetical protein ACF0H5_024554 [Mactra antiquata]
MAGIASNPGTTEKYIFRYQYLLVEIGGKILRSIFDLQVGRDLMQYLQNDPSKYKKLTSLMSPRGPIKGEQVAKLPPQNKNPCTSDFDITLLSCLLLNICQLPPSLEADVIMIRECRNHLNHRPSVIINAAEFEQRWEDLSKILNRLNKYAKITDLSDQIEKIKHKEIDEGSKAKLEEVLEKWRESDALIHHEIGDLKRRVTNVEEQQIIEKSKIERLERDVTALKTYLIKTYKETCSTLPVTALSEKDDEIELLEFYQPIKVIHKPYHRSTEDDTEYEISSFKEFFYKGEHCFKHIFLTAEAGLGKSSLCQCMTLLWSKVQANETFTNNNFQTNAAFMKQFDFVFHISLRDTYRDYILTMIVDLLLEFNDNDDELKKLLTYVSEQYNCLIIIDGLDEWTPSVQGRKPHTLPRKLQSDKCIYLTACRPYKIETERLTTRDIDCQVHISGMNRSEYKKYVNAVIQYVKKTRTVQGDVGEFFSEIERCGLSDHLRVPVITSQLILVWFKQKLTNMSRAVIYGNLVEMLFERADKKEQMKLSQIQSCDLQFPESFKEFIYIRKYAPLIEKVCLLAFRSLFKQDDNVSVLVFTSRKLMSEPYCITNEEMDFLCKLGILSKHKVIGNVGERELKLSFLHKSFIEFYAAMYVSFFDKKYDFHSVIIKWTKLIEIIEYENFLLLLSGLCHEKVNFLLDTIYTCSSLSDDIQACRDNLTDFYTMEISLIQDLVIKMFIEIRTQVDKNVCLKLEDFIFSKVFDPKYIETLTQLLLLNKTNVKCLYTKSGIFHDEFNQICNLQHISLDIHEQYNDRFNNLMLQNNTTLHTVVIVHTANLSQFPLRDLHNLTSLYLYGVVVPHECLHYIADHLSNNVNIQSLHLDRVKCSEHYTNCLHRINLQHWCNIKKLNLSNVNIIVSNINTTSLKSVTFWSLSNNIVRSYIDLFKYLESSKLEYLKVYMQSDFHFRVGNERRRLDNDTVNQLLNTLKTLSCIRKVELHRIDIPDNRYLLLHSDVTKVEIQLYSVTMSDKCFLSFVQHCTSKKADIVVALVNGTIEENDGDNNRDLTPVLSTNNESFQDNKDLLPHSDVTKVEIELYRYTMSDKCFLSFVRCCTSKKANIVVELEHCTIIKHDGDNIRILSKIDSCFYMYQHLTSIPNVIITAALNLWNQIVLHFKTRNYHEAV